MVRGCRAASTFEANPKTITPDSLAAAQTQVQQATTAFSAAFKDRYGAEIDFSHTPTLKRKHKKQRA